VAPLENPATENGAPQPAAEAAAPVEESKPIEAPPAAPVVAAAA
jgi:hypothetical protein